MGKKAGMAFLVVLVIALAIAGVMYLKNRAVENAAEDAALKERESWEHKNQMLEKKIGALEKEVDKLGAELKFADQAPGLDSDRRWEVFGDNETGLQQSAPALVAVHERVMKFFRYLDQRGYLRARGIEGTSLEYFRTIMDRVMQASPAISAESQDMLALLQNITYFFRLLGKSDTLLVRDIITAESELMEPTMKLLYLWMDPANAIEGAGRVTLPFEKQYEYAAYFLQTIGGKAYLFRRDSRMRLLMSYYSILVLDRADEAAMNSYGMDIRPLVSSLITEMQNSKVLADKHEYLNTLKIIKKKSEGIRIERPLDQQPPELRQ